LRGAGLRFAVEPARYGSSPTALRCISAWITWCWILPPQYPCLVPLAGTTAAALSAMRWLARNINTAEELALCRHAKT
jgi:EAL and modified HD-GYP domain-containing signal transduction protein